LVLAEFGLAVLGFPGNAAGFAVDRFSEFTGVPEALDGLAGAVQLFDVPVSLMEPLVSLLPGSSDVGARLLPCRSPSW
jgi:hypothetical protein